MKQCEPDPQFQIALLHIIKSYSTAVSPNTVLDSQPNNGDAAQVFTTANGTAAPTQAKQPPTAEEIQI